jgi:hypothetical protein
MNNFIDTKDTQPVINISFRQLFEKITRYRLLAVAVLLCTALFAGCATTNGNKPVEQAARLDKAAMEEKFGVEVVAIRLTAAGNMLDFRYRVKDPARALPLFGKNVATFLVDQASGVKSTVQDTANIGAMRSTSRNPVAGKEYFILFVNTSNFIKKGNRVTVAIGDFFVPDLVIE